MVNGVSDLKYMCARRVLDLFSSRSAKKTILTDIPHIHYLCILYVTRVNIIYSFIVVYEWYDELTNVYLDFILKTKCGAIFLCS